MNQGNRSDLLGSINTDKNEGSSPWILHFDDENQAHYYFNAQTGECKWAEVTQSNPTEHSEYYPEGGDTAEYDFDEIDGESVSNMSRISTMSVVERSEQMLAHKREKQEALRYQLQQRELEGLRSGPEINQRSKQLNRKVDDIFAWEDKRKAKLEMLAAQVRMEEDSQITGRPHLYAPMISSGASVCSSFNSVISTGSGSEGLSVEERLLAYEEKRKLKLQQTIAHEQNEARKAATPTLAPHSANLNRSRVAHSYSNASTSDSQNSSQYGGSYLGRGTADGTAPGILKDNSTGQIMFQPKLNKRSELMAAQSRPSIPVEDLLTGKGQLQKQRLQEKERRVEQKAQQLSEIRKVNPKSEKLVQERYILQGETTSDRLARPIGNVKAKVLEEIEQPTFRPTLNPVSVEIATSNNGFYNLPAAQRQHNHMGTAGGNYCDGVDDRGQPEPEEDSGTFDRFDSMYYNDEYSIDDGPLLYEDYLRSAGKKNNNSNRSVRNGASGGGDGGDNNGSRLYDSSQSLAGGGGSQQQQDIMYQKTRLWEEMRQAKLDKGRRERERQQAAECTFKPHIDPRSRNIAYENDNELQDGVDPINSYLERQLSWVEKREQKLEIERQKAASKEVEGCSFTPQLRRNASITSTSAVKARPGAVNERSTHRSNAQTAYSATTKQSTSVRRAGKWADEGPYFVDGNRAELADLSSMDMMTAEQDRNDNVADTPTRTYNDSHFFDPEEEEEAGDGLENRRAAELPLAESEGPMPRRVPVPPHSSALNRAASHSTQITAATPATRCRSPGGDAFDEGDEEQEPVSVGRLKVPLPSKSTVAPRITSATPHPQPTTISVRVPSNKNDQYEDGSDYIDYEPSPSSGVMLARSAPGNVHRKNVHFSAAWADENAHTSFGYNQYTHEEDYDEGPRTTAAVGTVEERERGREGEYYEGYEEGDYEDYDRASSQYNGLPFQVEKGRLEQHRASGQQERFTPPRSAAGSNQLFRSPPYPSASAPPLRFRTHSGPEAPEVSAGLFPHQHHQQQHQGQHSYSFAGLAEPEDAEFAHFSLFDVGQLELHADASYSAADSSTHLPPPPPPPLEDVEDVRKYAQQPAVLIRGSLPPPYASASGEGNALAASQNSRAALPLHTQYRQKQQEHSTHDHHPGERSPSNNNEHLSCDVYGDDGYGEAVEFSPSPSKVSFPHQLAYDML